MPDNGVSSWPATDNLNLPADMDTRAPTSAGDGNYTFKQWLERVTGMLRAIYTDLNVGKVADFPMGSHKITGLADGSATTDAATWGQVQALINGLDWTHPAARVIATSNITLSGAQTIDGVSAVAGDRVLAAGQTTGSQNGLYVVASGAWARAADADTSAEVPPGMAVVVNEGTANGDTVWILTTNAPITLGSTALTFAELPTPNALLAGAGLTRTGNTIDAVATDASVTVVADSLKANIASFYGALASDVDPGGSSATTFTSFFTQSFTAPPSGVVLVTVDCSLGPQTQDNFVRAVVNSTNFSLGRFDPTSANTQHGSRTFRVSGLTPGNSYNVDVQYKVTTGGIFHCRANSLNDYEWCSVAGIATI